MKYQTVKSITLVADVQVRRTANTPSIADTLNVLFTDGLDHLDIVDVFAASFYMFARNKNNKLFSLTMSDVHSSKILSEQKQHGGPLAESS